MRLSVKSASILIELDEKRDLHMTLICSKKIKTQVNLVDDVKSYPELY